MTNHGSFLHLVRYFIKIFFLFAIPLATRQENRGLKNYNCHGLCMKQFWHKLHKYYSWWMKQYLRWHYSGLLLKCLTKQSLLSLLSCSLKQSPVSIQLTDSGVHHKVSCSTVFLIDITTASRNVLQAYIFYTFFGTAKELLKFLFFSLNIIMFAVFFTDYTSVIFCCFSAGWFLKAILCTNIWPNICGHITITPIYWSSLKLLPDIA